MLMVVMTFGTESVINALGVVQRYDLSQLLSGPVAQFAFWPTYGSLMMSCMSCYVLHRSDQVTRPWVCISCLGKGGAFEL
jgi:hypothetical protein